MSLHHAAQHLAAQGRHGDDMLVHMNKEEVAGLHALAAHKGTHLTTNPHTGLPEAFSLGDLNPVRIVEGKGAIGETGLAPLVLGAALGPAGLGLMSAGAAGLTVGGITALASGNLGRGLMAGLGAYGGASLSAGLAGMGAASPEALASNAATAGSDMSAAQIEAAAKAQTPMLDKISSGASYAVNNPVEALKTLGEGSAWKGAGILGAAAAPVLAGNMVQTATPAPTQNQGLVRPYTFQRKVVTPTDMVQPTYQPGQSTAERNWFQDRLTAQTPYQAPGPEYSKTYAAGGDVDADTETDPNLQQIPAFDPVVRMASGGIASFSFDPQTQTFRNLSDVLAAANTAQTQTPTTTTTTPDYGTMPRFAYDPQTQRLTKIEPPPPPQNEEDMAQGGAVGYASGGLGSLGGYAAGGNPRLLKGPGDGMSDNIPAVIGNKQPARLADGEFVVPADVVSHLGNGSTDAGAKQLYKMMDRIRQQRTGKKRQAPEVNPTKSMPA